VVLCVCTVQRKGVNSLSQWYSEGNITFSLMFVETREEGRKEGRRARGNAIMTIRRHETCMRAQDEIDTTNGRTYIDDNEQ
jgi:hypothetical protein